MSDNKIPFDEVLSGRVTARDKKLMKDSGYGVRDAVSLFLKLRASPKKALLVDKHFVQESINQLKEEIESLNMDLIAEEMKLEEINNRLGIVELNGKDYSLEVNTAIGNIIQRYSSSSYDLEDYFKIKHLFVENQAAVIEMDVDELKDLVRETVSKQEEFTS